MSKPRTDDYQRLKRLGRFLKGHPRTTIHYKWQPGMSEVTIHTDANRAGDKVNRKSTSGGVIQIGSHF
eukprot:9205874-Karenia_brevis.AAC.1